MTTFIEEVREGRQTVAQVDDWVGRWHDGAAGDALELGEFLGLNKDQYAAWVRDPSVLASFV